MTTVHYAQNYYPDLYYNAGTSLNVTLNHYFSLHLLNFIQMFALKYYAPENLY